MFADSLSAPSQGSYKNIHFAYKNRTCISESWLDKSCANLPNIIGVSQKDSNFSYKLRFFSHLIFFKVLLWIDSWSVGWIPLPIMLYAFCSLASVLMRKCVWKVHLQAFELDFLSCNCYLAITRSFQA